MARRLGVTRLSRAPLYTFRAGKTRVSKLRSSTGIYGKRVSAANPDGRKAIDTEVRVRKGRR